MKIPFKIPNRFCAKHGEKMTPGRMSREFYTTTGALKNQFVSHSCPKWYCFETTLTTLVWDGVVQEEVK